MTTVIATKKAIYADSLCDCSIAFYSDKIFRVGESIYGVAGDLEEALQFIEWRKTGNNKPEFAESVDFDAIEVNKTGIYLWQTKLVRMAVKNKTYAIGSGGQYAMGAMDEGATPEKAMKIAEKRDSSTRLPLQKIELNP